MSTPNYGWPFPTLGDPPNGPAAIQALAEAIDTTVAAQDASDGLSGLRLQRGYQVGSPNASGQFPVTFPSPFAGPPVLMVALGDDSTVVQSVAPVYSTITASGFTVTCRRSDGSVQTSGSFRVVWIAVGPS